MDLGDDEFAGVIAVAIEERLYFGEEIEIFSASAAEPSFALGGGDFEGFVKECFEFLPALGIHEG